MKALFIFPPQSGINGIAGGAAALSGMLNGLGYESSVLDLNIDFYNYILNTNFINKCIKTIQNSTNEKVKKIYDENKEKYHEYLGKLKTSVKVLRNGKSFYNLKLLLYSYHVIETILEVISLAYYPFRITPFNFFKINDFIKYEDFKLYTNQNIFTDFFKKYINNIIDYNPDYIGISVLYDSQVIAALTLCKLIKMTNLNAKIILGGANITKRILHIKNDNILFRDYIDAAMIGQGEKSTIEYMEYLSGKRNINDVSNIYRMQDNKVICNNTVYTPYQGKYTFDYRNYDAKKYFMPEGVLLLTTSYGCYWNKCSFCNQNKDIIYNQKSPDEIILEIEDIIKEKKSK